MRSDKMTKFKALPFLLLISISIVHSSTLDSKQYYEGDKIHTIVKRQTSTRKLEDARTESRATAVSVASRATSSSSDGVSPSFSAAEEADKPIPLAEEADGSISRPKVHPQQPSKPVGELGDQDNIPVARPNRKRRPASARRPRPVTRPQDFDEGRGRYDSEDEDCDDYGGNDYEYGPNLFNMATRPMRQFSRMMGGMFDQMQGLASGGGFDDYPGANYAVASSRSGNDGYSRMSSISSNNGRTRGIVSETRDGRTRTRRIGDDGDDDRSEY